MNFYAVCRQGDLLAFKDEIPFRVEQKGSIVRPFIFPIEAEVSLYRHNDYYFGFTNGFWLFPIKRQTFFDTNPSGKGVSWAAEDGFIIGCEHEVAGPWKIDFKLLNYRLRMNAENSTLQRNVKLENPAFTGGNVQLIADVSGLCGVLTGKGIAY